MRWSEKHWNLQKLYAKKSQNQGTKWNEEAEQIDEMKGKTKNSETKWKSKNGTR